MPRHGKWWIAAAVIAVGCYTTLWLGFALHWSWLGAVDSTMLDPLHRYGMKHPAWVSFWELISIVFGPWGFRLAAAAIVIFAVTRRNLRAILFVLATLALSGVLTETAKYLADRPRPLTAMTAAASTSFPSGHAIVAMVGVLALLTLSAGMLSRRSRVVTVVAGAVIVIAVGFSRVALNVHYPSDVLAGWALGYLWFCICVLAIRPVSLARAAAPDAEPIGAAADETLQAPGIGH